MPLNGLYKALLFHFGPQRWWPAETPFEVMVGAILTQNTSWSNVEKSIQNLKSNNLLTPSQLINLSDDALAALIKPSGYYNLKTRRLKNFLNFFMYFNFEIENLKKNASIRENLLKINGIGKETADSILLYALDMPYFVVDSYTRRILFRLKLIDDYEAPYDEIQSYFHRLLPRETGMFNEFHALIVTTAKEYCRKKPVCAGCPLVRKCWYHKAERQIINRKRLPKQTEKQIG